MSTKKENLNKLSTPTKIEVITSESRPNGSLDNLALMYATSFWADSWQELLIDAQGNQYGTYDQQRRIYPNTRILLTDNNISTDTPDWPTFAWQLAGKRMLFQDGVPVRQYWTLEKAKETLLGFTKPIEQGGFNGEVMVLKDQTDKIVGFTAYTVSSATDGPDLVQSRFPYQQLTIGSPTDTPQAKTLAQLVDQCYRQQRVGIFLDFAISENYRGLGFGSQLFDARLDRLVNLNADVIIGRTIKTSPAQYDGNYIARGLQPIAFDPLEPNKAIFAVSVKNILPRRKK